MYQNIQISQNIQMFQAIEIYNIINNNNASSVASADIKIKVDGARGVKTAAVN